MAMSLNFRRFHSAVVVMAAFAAGSANAQQTIRTVPIFYFNSVPQVRAVQVTSEDGGPGQGCTPVLGQNKENIGPTMMTGHIYTFVAMSTSNCAPGTGLAGLFARIVGLPTYPNGINMTITARRITGDKRG
ncbi:hypothetical protein K8O61_06770 [Xanthomonas cerealis pv. cerealis]|uniref:hypothetical protein n=1 Tax=Xanthomonas cerealis TaxID=3390025 RepID=UPI001F2591A6|nr:hypothetical protein [Xanthomonas translucens]UKE70724.1 hypothetical protein K8O61_06770 [Xanthomonas translucens pv. pistacia]